MQLTQSSEFYAQVLTYTLKCKQVNVIVHQWIMFSGAWKAEIFPGPRGFGEIFPWADVWVQSGGQRGDCQTPDGVV
jgi:hypothetical protein